MKYKENTPDFAARGVFLIVMSSGLEVVVALVFTLCVISLLVAEEEPTALVGAANLHDMGHGILE